MMIINTKYTFLIIMKHETQKGVLINGYFCYKYF